MDRLMEQIRDDEALLVAYATGELSGEDLADVERRLAADAGLAARAEQMRRDYDALVAGIGAADDGTRLPAAEARATRQASRAIRQWQADRLTHVPAPAEREPFKLPAWSYGVAASVAVLVGFCYWWANNPVQVAVPEVATTEPTAPVAAPTGPAASPERGGGFYASAEPSEPVPLAFQDLHSEYAEMRLRVIESDLYALHEADDNIGMLWTESNQ